MTNQESCLAALPVFNEARYVNGVLDEVRQYAKNVLVVDDGSTDGTSEMLQQRDDVSVVRHPQNQGYGAALMTAFRYAIEHQYEVLVTLDCDGQHQPLRIPRFFEAAKAADIVSGSRYLKQYQGDDAPPPQRLFINRQITRQVNRRLGFALTDTFCGFKAYRVSALKQLVPHIVDPGYAMPLQVWVWAAVHQLRVIELPVPLIYLDLNRSFGGALDDAEVRMQHYNRVIDDAIRTACKQGYRVSADRNLCQEVNG
jgi:glycosyltransferase involved in cell wall biosynthesis